MTKLSTEELKAFGQDNVERFLNNQNDPGVILVEVNDFVIANPFVSECGRFSVVPNEHYGKEAFTLWKQKVAEKMN